MKLKSIQNDIETDNKYFESKKMELLDSQKKLDVMT